MLHKDRAPCLNGYSFASTGRPGAMDERESGRDFCGQEKNWLLDHKLMQTT